MREDAILQAAWDLLASNHLLAEIRAVSTPPQFLQSLLIDPESALASTVPAELCLDLQEFVDTLLRLLARETEAQASDPGNLLHMVATLSDANLLTPEQASAIGAVLAASKLAQQVTNDANLPPAQRQAFQTADRFAKALAATIHAFHRDHNADALVAKALYLASAAQSLASLLPKNESAQSSAAGSGSPTPPLPPPAAPADAVPVETGSVPTPATDGDDDEARMAYYGKTVILTRLQKLLKAGQLSLAAVAAAARALHDGEKRLLDAFETWRQNLSDDEAVDMENNVKFETTIAEIAASLVTTEPAADGTGEEPKSKTIVEQIEDVLAGLYSDGRLNAEQAERLVYVIRDSFTETMELKPEVASPTSPSHDHSKQKAVRTVIKKFIDNHNADELAAGLTQLSGWLNPPANAPGDRD